MRLERNSESSDLDVSHDSGIYIPRRVSPIQNHQERARKAAQRASNEYHWRAVNKRHLESGIPSHPVSNVSCFMVFPMAIERLIIGF